MNRWSTFPTGKEVPPGSFGETRKQQNRLLFDYEHDFSKYADASLAEKIRLVWNSAPDLARGVLGRPVVGSYLPRSHQLLAHIVLHEPMLRALEDADFDLVDSLSERYIEQLRNYYFVGGEEFSADQ